jgi:hypothetical protein
MAHNYTMEFKRIIKLVNFNVCGLRWPYVRLSNFVIHLKFVQHFGQQAVQNGFLEPGTLGSVEQCLGGDGLCILHAQQIPPAAQRVESIKKDGLIICGSYSSEVSWCVTEVWYSPSSLFNIFYHFGWHLLRWEIYV